MAFTKALYYPWIEIAMKNVFKLLGFILICFLNIWYCSPSFDPVSGNTDPTILSLTANPDTVGKDELSELTCSAIDLDGDELTFVWETDSGSVNGSGSNVNWLSPETVGEYFVTCTVLNGNGGEAMDSVKILVTVAWEITSFPGDLYGNWYSDYDGSWQWSIDGSTTIRTFNRFFSVHSTYGLDGAEYEYKVITTEGGRWYTFFFKNVTASHMHATFTDCPSSPTGFDTENEALEASSVYNQFCNGNHK